VVLAGKHAARAPKAGLHLVYDEQGSPFTAQSLCAAKVLAGARNDPALALHYFQYDRGRLTVYGLFQAL
jgi:hypothetical protein